jgi:HAD superfamily hydrolase (TIGR01509 family)
VARIRAEYGWEPPPRFDEEFDELQREAFGTELRAVPGAAAVVRAVRSRRAVVSNGSRAEMTLKLGKVGLLDAFAQNLFSAEEVPRSKPFPDVYLRATAALGVSPSEAIVVEDSIPGVRAAVAAGLTVFGFAAATGADALRAHGARPFQDMAELPDLLRAQGVDVYP